MFRSKYVAIVAKEFFKGIATKYGLVLHALEVASDHVHMFVEIPIKMSVWHAIRLLKALSAKCLFQAFPGFKKRYPRGRFWSGYTYYESIGKVTASKIEKYITESQNKHKTLNKWQARNAGA
ncbi:IS200/IS605 family transposase [archaeon]|nr:IS200/IS605 family transposase [archaeon]